MSIAVKILARVLLNRLLPLTEESLPERHCGFRTFRGTTDTIYVSDKFGRNVWNKTTIYTWLSLTSTPPIVKLPRTSGRGCPVNVISILRLLHDKMTATVFIDGTKTEPFTIRTGVK